MRILGTGFKRGIRLGLRLVILLAFGLAVLGQPRGVRAGEGDPFFIDGGHRHIPRDRAVRGSDIPGLGVGLGLGLGTAIGAGIAAGQHREDVVLPEFCYVHRPVAGVITCRKRGARGQTCESHCDLIEDGTDLGETPPPKLFNKGSRYECQCQD